VSSPNALVHSLCAAGPILQTLQGEEMRRLWTAEQETSKNALRNDSACGQGDVLPAACSNGVHETGSTSNLPTTGSASDLQDCTASDMSENASKEFKDMPHEPLAVNEVLDCGKQNVSRELSHHSSLFEEVADDVMQIETASSVHSQVIITDGLNDFIMTNDIRAQVVFDAHDTDIPENVPSPYPAYASTLARPAPLHGQLRAALPGATQSVLSQTDDVYGNSASKGGHGAHESLARLAEAIVVAAPEAIVVAAPEAIVVAAPEAIVVAAPPGPNSVSSGQVLYLSSPSRRTLGESSLENLGGNCNMRKTYVLPLLGCEDDAPRLSEGRFRTVQITAASTQERQQRQQRPSNTWSGVHAQIQSPMRGLPRFGDDGEEGFSLFSPRAFSLTATPASIHPRTVEQKTKAVFLSDRNTETGGTMSASNATKHEKQLTPMRASLMAFEKLRAQLLENMVSTVRDTRICRGQESEFVDTPSSKKAPQDATVLTEPAMLDHENCLLDPGSRLEDGPGNDDACVRSRSSLAMSPSTLGSPLQTASKPDLQLVEEGAKADSKYPYSSPPCESSSDLLDTPLGKLALSPHESPSRRLIMDAALDSKGSMLPAPEVQEFSVTPSLVAITHSSVAVGDADQVNAHNLVQSLAVVDVASDASLMQPHVPQQPSSWAVSASAVFYGFCERIPEILTPSHLLRPRKLRPEVKDLLGQCHGRGHTHTRHT